MGQMRAKRMLPLLVAGGIGLAIGGSAYAFTASNTVPATTVGAGVGAVGFTVTNPHFSLDATAPANIDSMTFTISPAVPSTGSGNVIITAALSSGGPLTYTCRTDTGGRHVTCPTTTPTQLTKATLKNVTVVAAQ